MREIESCMRNENEGFWYFTYLVPMHVHSVRASEQQIDPGWRLIAIQLSADFVGCVCGALYH